MSNSVWPYGQQPTRLLCPWDSLGKILEWVITSISIHKYIFPYPCRRKCNPLQYLCLQNSMDRGAGGLQSMGSQRIGHDWVTNNKAHILRITSVQFSRSVVSDSLWPHESQHARPPCPSSTPGVHSKSHPSSRWCHPAISFSVLLPPISPSIRVFSNESTLRMRWPKYWSFSFSTQDWSTLEWTGWISLQSKRLSRVFSNTTVQKHQFFGAQPSSQSNSHIHTWLLEKP